MLRLLTLGRLQLTREGPVREQIPVQPKRLALLAYLALTAADGFERRDILLALFWPHANGPQARRCLRQALFHLRNVLGDGVIVNGGEQGIALAAERLWCDAAAVDSALRERRAHEALAIYGGDFLPAVFVADCSSELENWIQRTRERLRAGVAAGALELVERELREGRTSSALESALVVRRLSPDDERGLRQHMIVLDRLGDRAAALREYCDFGRRLQREFDAQPSLESQRLAEGLTRGQSVSRTPRAVTEDGGSLPPSPTPARRRAAVGKWGRRAALCGCFLVSGIGYGVTRIREPAPPLGGYLVVSPFANHTPDPLLGTAVTAVLRADLAQIAEVRQSGREEPERPALGVITGNVSRLGPGFTVSAQLAASPDGQVLAVLREDAADSTQLLRTVHRLSGRLRARIADSIRLRRPPDSSRPSRPSRQARASAAVPGNW